MSIFTLFWVSSIWAQTQNLTGIDSSKKWSNPLSTTGTASRIGITANRLIRHSLNLEGLYTLGFGPDYTMIHNEQVNTRSNHGFQLQVNNLFSFRNFPIQLGLGIGWRHFYFSGEGDNFTYQGNANKLVGKLYAILPVNQYGLMTGIEIENNRDFDHFESRKTDMFRYSLGIGVSRNINKKLSLNLWYNRVLAPFSNHYLLINPANHLKIGFRYMLR